METYRDILRDIITDAALADAERRAYWQQTDPGDPFACDDGYCALGIMLLHDSPALALSYPFPAPHCFAGADEYEDCLLYRRRRFALGVIARANDRGLLRVRGNLTALLDRPFRVPLVLR